MGRPSKYKVEYCEQIIDYFSKEPYHNEKLIKTNRDGTTEEKLQEVANDLPLISGFATMIGVHRDTINEWARIHPEFSDSLKRAKDLQRSMLITNGLRGNYSTTFAIFTAKNITDMRDVQINVNKEKEEDERDVQDRINELLDKRKNDAGV